MANQQKIILMGQLQGIMVDIEGESMRADFEVIEIVDKSNPYPTFLGIDWDFSMDSLIKLKRRSMVFEKNGTKVVIPLDPSKGAWYTEPVREEYGDEDIDHIYKLNMCDEDWIKPPQMDG